MKYINLSYLVGDVYSTISLLKLHHANHAKIVHAGAFLMKERI